MKKKYNINSKFFVVFALNERAEIYEEFKLQTIRNKVLGLYDTISAAPNNELTDGEIAETLLKSIINIYSNSTLSYCLPAIINWYLI